MENVQIYTTTYCPYCVKAKRLLTHKEIQFTEIDVTEDVEMRLQLVEMSGGQKTVPQIFIDGKHVGGCDDLYSLDASGELNQLLGRA